ncbi:MAG: hypothetical protein AAF742_08585, partial [Pseudomonadota bacterium]
MDMEIDAHLLIVDGDQQMRALLQKFLMRHGFMSSSARDAAHARRLLNGLSFDMIVLGNVVAKKEEDGFCFSSLSFIVNRQGDII